MDIDQRSQEVLGHWPFPRLYFAQMLDALREDGASVAAFDITFSKPDQSDLPLRIFPQISRSSAPRAQRSAPQVLSEVKSKEAQYNYDQQFADAIQRFGNVVLGNYFLYTQVDLQGVSSKSLDEYANLIAFFPFPQVRALPSARGQQGPPESDPKIRRLISCSARRRGERRNFHRRCVIRTRRRWVFSTSSWIRTAWCGACRWRFPMAATPIAPIGIFMLRSKCRRCACISASPSQQTVLNYGGGGIVSVEFGPNLIVHPDDVGRMMMNYHGPARTYPYVSFADAALNKFPKGTFQGQNRLVGASATGIGDLRATPLAGSIFPASKSTPT